MVKVGKGILTILLIASAAMAATSVKQDADLEAGRRAFEASELCEGHSAAASGGGKDPRNEMCTCCWRRVIWRWNS